jgi:hypothetical protein
MLWKTLTHIAAVLGASRCWYYDRAFHFDLGGGRTLAVSPDSASRVRLSVCQDGRDRATFWATSDRQDRVVSIVRQAVRDEAALTGRA